MYYFLKNLLYFQALIRQTKYKVMMTKEGSTKIGNFLTHIAGVLMLGCGHWIWYFTISGLKSDLYLGYWIEDVITPHYWSCSVLIILTNQSLLLFDWKYFGSFDLLIWVDYMPEVSRKCNNKTTFIIFKNFALQNTLSDWSKSWHIMQTTKFIQSALEHDQ